MSNDAKLQKVILGPDWIDLSFGEPKVIFDALFRNLDSSLKMPTTMSLKKYEYQPAQGMPKLVEFLENKYQAKVIVTNGAKHGLGAVMDSLKKNNYESIYFDTPYYPATPFLIAKSGLREEQSLRLAKAALFTSPNNPDGKNYSNNHMNSFKDSTYVVHDAAYYTPIYLPYTQKPEKIGHIQVFSASKMYGLSGIRIGYVVCYDESLVKNIIDYVEETTAGVSTASQEIILEIEKFFLTNPEKKIKFEKEAKEAISENRKILKKIKPEVLEIADCQSNSMFGWFKKGPKLNAEKAKVYMLDGALFGQEGMIRMNIAVNKEILAEAVDRLNLFV